MSELEILSPVTAVNEPIDDAPPALPTPAPEPYFGAGKATAIFALSLVAQFVAAMVTMVFVLLVVMATSGTRNLVDRATTAGFMPMALLSVAAGGAVAFALTRLWAWHLRDRPGIHGLGFRAGTRQQQLTSAAIGIALAVTWILLMHYVVPMQNEDALGPMARAAAQKGVSRIFFIIVAVIVAPLCEELLFRSVLLAGFARRFGTTVAGITVSLTFVALHLPETFKYPPALLAIATLSAVLLALRVKTDSVVTPMIAHCAYNTTLVLTLMAT